MTTPPSWLRRATSPYTGEALKKIPAFPKMQIPTGTAVFPSTVPGLFKLVWGALSAVLSGSGGHGPWRGGGPEPYGRCWWPFSCGSRAPWSAGASWADRYGTLHDTSILKISPPRMDSWRRVLDSGRKVRRSRLEKCANAQLILYRKTPTFVNN